MASGWSLQATSNRMYYALHEEVEKRTQEQRRILMYLVADFLREQGLFKTCGALAEEAQLSSSYQICDNIDLQIILSEYTDYYHSRFQKWPQICKRVDIPSPKASSNLTKACCQKDNTVKPQPQDSDELEESLPAYPGLTVTPLSQKDAVSSGPPDDISPVFDGEKVLRPLGDLYPDGSEWKEIAEDITREIVTTNLNVHWDDVYGLDECKELLKDAVLYPTQYPQYFDSLFTPRKGILLYGPPGTGKTMLARVIATECDLTFFNISTSSLVRTWRGDSEKYVRVLFELANYHAPSIIFIDEIDEIDRVAAGPEACGSENSKPTGKFKAALLARLDSYMSENDSRVIFLAATNAPWSLDSALRRRLQIHIHVDVPNSNGRRKILEVYTEKALRLDSVVQQTDGYTSDDLKRLCKEAWMHQMRPTWSSLKNAESNENIDLLDKPKLIDDSLILFRATTRILCTAKQLRGKYERWKDSLID